jgi:hypothetical protein
MVGRLGGWLLIRDPGSYKAAFPRVDVPTS